MLIGNIFILTRYLNDITYQNLLLYPKDQFSRVDRSYQILPMVCSTLALKLSSVPFYRGTIMILYRIPVNYIMYRTRSKLQYESDVCVLLTSNAVSTLSSSVFAFAVANTVNIYSSKSILPFPCWNSSASVNEALYFREQ